MIDLLAPQLMPLEKVIAFTPLGIRFRDAATGEPVTDGLVVRARLAASPQQGAVARATQTGAYAFHDLPGLRHLAYPEVSVVNMASPPESKRYIVDVRDPRMRFAPVAFEADAPHEGLFTLGLNGSPPSDASAGFYLFPAVTRTAPPSLGVVRSWLVERGSGKPAAHAVLELTLPDGSHTYGLADNQGRVAAMVPYPRFAPAVLSPPQSSLDAIEPDSWAMTARVRYQRATQATLAAELPPNLVSLFGQGDAQIWPIVAGPPADRLDFAMVFGREAVLRTGEEPELFVS